MKKETAFGVIIRKLLIIVATILFLTWLAYGIYNPWESQQDCNYQDEGCQGDNSKFGQ
jgi:hypothetical protein